MPPMHMLIKPASGSCNLRCRYCFYLDEAQNREVESYGMMSVDTLKSVVGKAIMSADDGLVSFGFQGGEPMLRGLDFFREAVRLQREYAASRRVRIVNSIQTNGTLIDDEWAAFFAGEKFLVGVSLDGHIKLNDANRLTPGGEGSFFKVMNGIEHLKRRGAEFNILSVVTSRSARDAGRIYRFFAKNELKYQQYIPCLDPMNAGRGECDYSLTPDMYARFFIELFSLWFEDMSAGNFVYIRQFENLLNVVMGYPPEHCGMFGRCAMQYVIEADGGVYPCDFYAVDRYRLGNIADDSIEDILGNLEASRFIEESLKVEGECGECEWYGVCRGGCRRDRDFMGEVGLNYYCPALKRFYEFAMPRLEWMAARVRA